jgi:hypothetical protein
MDGPRTTIGAIAVVGARVTAGPAADTAWLGRVAVRRAAAVAGRRVQQKPHDTLDEPMPGHPHAPERRRLPNH